ncbi:MAG: PTS system mannose/fructose/N-acetylgalactosamine-transporter subunit IIB [Gemmatimonadales bacterium]
MSVDLVRVDDRLIHGQVVVGWVQAMGVRRIVLVNDEVCNSQWERDLMKLGVPPDLEVEFVSVEEAAACFPEWVQDGKRTIVLLADIATLVQLYERHAPVMKVNIGGVHDDVGRKERLSYVYLTDDEVRQLRRLIDDGIAVTAQDVPTAKPVALGELV